MGLPPIHLLPGAIHLLLVLLHNIASLSGGTLQPGRLLHLAPVAYYAQYSGIARGYGFFAPQVGSTCRLELDLYDDDGTLLERCPAAGLTLRESRLRFTGFLDLFHTLLPQDEETPEDTLRQRYAQAVARNIADRYARRKYPHRRVSVHYTVLVNRQPTLRGFRPGDRAQRILLHRNRVTSAPQP